MLYVGLQLLTMITVFIWNVRCLPKTYPKETFLGGFFFVLFFVFFLFVCLFVCFFLVLSQGCDMGFGHSVSTTILSYLIQNTAVLHQCKL